MIKNIPKIVLISVLSLFFVFYVSEKFEINTENQPKKKNKKEAVLKSTDFSLRKYKHVKDFYRPLVEPVTDLCIKENVPPAAVLAMAGLESGWNKGYISRITGNILSLGSRKGDKQLPPLYLPTNIESGDVVFDSITISNHHEPDLIWKNRPPSFKKDYRPDEIAGTSNKLAYFKRHPDERAKAQLQNISDFLKIFISHNSKIKAYKDARQHLDSIVKKHGKSILLEEDAAKYFVNAISGRPNTFNYRKTWPKKVIYIIDAAGLIDLTKSIYLRNESFEDAW